MVETIAMTDAAVPRGNEIWLPSVRVGVCVGAATIAFVAVTGGLAAVVSDGNSLHRWFDLDAEFVVPALISGAMLFLAGFLAFVAASWDLRPRAWQAIGAFFAFMGVDEIASVHERLESRAGIDWQTLYIPVVLIGASAFSLVLVRLSSRMLVVGWLGGAVAWLVSQGFEYFQWNGDELVHSWMIVPEEVLELTGSTVWVITLVAFVHSRREG